MNGVLQVANLTINRKNLLAASTNQPWRLQIILCFVDHASLYNLVNKANLVCTIFLSMFISFLYMFRVSMCPSSVETTVFMQHLVLVIILYGWLSGMQGGMSLIPPCIPDSCFFWWWAHRCPKHVQKRNKYTKKNCAPSWLY